MGDVILEWNTNYWASVSGCCHKQCIQNAILSWSYFMRILIFYATLRLQSIKILQLKFPVCSTVIVDIYYFMSYWTVIDAYSINALGKNLLVNPLSRTLFWFLLLWRVIDADGHFSFWTLGVGSHSNPQQTIQRFLFAFNGLQKNFRIIFQIKSWVVGLKMFTLWWNC